MDKYFKIVKESYTFTCLEWDSEYFQIPCYKLTLQGAALDNVLDNIYSQLPKGSFLTIINEKNNKENNINITSYFKDEVFFADFNIRFVQNIHKNEYKTTLKYEIKDCIGYDKEIDRIAKESFKYSRFYNDRYLDSLKKMDIYSHWVNSAFESKGRFYLTVKNQTGETIAFTLFSVDQKNKDAVIELIAIDKGIQKQGLGTEMIRILKSYLYGYGILELFVGTQSENIEGMNFYYKSGFKVCSCSSIYHMWKK